VFGSIRFLFERYQAGWISQQKVVEPAGLLNFMEIPIMRMITATTAFKMPLYDISFSLSTFSNPCQASLYIYKGLLLSGSQISGQRICNSLFFKRSVSFCLETLCRSHFTSTMSNYGSSCFFGEKSSARC
jgi:hypothetical protein